MDDILVKSSENILNEENFWQISRQNLWMKFLDELLEKISEKFMKQFLEKKSPETFLEDSLEKNLDKFLSTDWKNRRKKSMMNLWVNSILGKYFTGIFRGAWWGVLEWTLIKLFCRCILEEIPERLREKIKKYSMKLFRGMLIYRVSRGTFDRFFRWVMEVFSGEFFA